jgi:hypothetical protein
MQFTSEQRLDDGVLEREFILGEIPGILWTSGSAPAPLILSGHNGGLHKRNPRLVARARHHAAEYGFAVAAIDAPGHGDRPRSAVDEQARADLRRAMESGEPVEKIVDAFIVVCQQVLRRLIGRTLRWLNSPAAKWISTAGRCGRPHSR